MTLVAWCGDSITAGAAAAWRANFRDMTLKLLGARMSAESINAGVNGDRSDQVLDRLPAVLVADPLCVVMVGTNDAGQGVSVETFRANVEAIHDMAPGSVFALVPPRGYDGPEMELTRRYNLWLRSWCHRRGLPLVDTWGALVDPATGLLAAAYDSGDGVHPNSAGHLAMAEAFAEMLRPLLPARVWDVASIGGMLPDPLGTGTSGWVHTAGSWAPLSTVAALPGELPAGAWVRITATTSNATWGAPLGTEGVAWDEGDVLLVAAYLRGGVDKVQLFSGSAPIGDPIEAVFPANPGPLLRKVTIPAVAGTLRLGVTAKAGTSVDVGACDVYNLTRLGLTDLEV